MKKTESPFTVPSEQGTSPRPTKLTEPLSFPLSFAIVYTRSIGVPSGPGILPPQRPAGLNAKAAETPRTRASAARMVGLRDIADTLCLGVRSAEEACAAEVSGRRRAPAGPSVCRAKEAA